MFAGQQSITNGLRKIKNPTKIKGVTNKYEGLITNDFNFKYQTNNFNKIIDSLKSFDIFVQDIYYAERKGKPIFIVTFTNPNILWHKYEGDAYGSGHNHMYIGSKKIKTTNWISMEKNEINDLLFDQLNKVELLEQIK